MERPIPLLPPVTIDYLLVDDESDPARSVVAEYSLSGGGQWLPATAEPGTITEELAASPAGTAHQFEWDADADAVAVYELERAERQQRLDDAEAILRDLFSKQKGGG